MHRAVIVPALAILGLTAAPLIPTSYTSSSFQTGSSLQMIPASSNPRHQVMAAPVMHQQSPQTAVTESEYVEPTPSSALQPAIVSRAFSGDVGAMVRAATGQRFGTGQVDAMMTLMGKESGLNPYAVNKSSGACGIPQAYPCSLLLAIIGSLDNVAGQVEWLMTYVANRYGTPGNALAHHRAKGWY